MGFGASFPDFEQLIFDVDLGTGGLVAPEFRVTELNGQRRTIVLLGRALPYRPAAWGGKQRTKLTWYQGNPVATQQVLGPEESTSTFNGAWKDRFVQRQIELNGDWQAITSAEQAVLLFEDMRRSGSTVRVQWGSVVRTGVLVSFTAKWDRLQDVEWEAEFEWSSVGQQRARVVRLSTRSPAAEMSLLDQVLAFGPAIDDIAERFIAATITSIDEMRKHIGSVLTVLSAINRAAAAPQQVYSSLASATESLRLQVLEEMQRLHESTTWGKDPTPEGVDSTSSALLAGAPAPESGGVSLSGDVQDVLRATRDTRALGAQMRALWAAVEDARERVAAQVAPEQVDEVIAPADTSFYALSSQYYGTPDLAGWLARFNGVRGTLIVPAGTVLRIPPPPAAGEEAERC